MMLLSICDNPDVLRVLRVVKIIIQILKIAVPIALLLSLMFDYMKAIYDKDADALKKVNTLAVRRCVAAALIFLIPTFVNLVINMAAVNIDYNSCLRNATKANINALYEKSAKEFVDKARKEITDSSYGRAVLEVSRVRDASSRAKLEEELKEIKKKLEEKHKKEEEERKAKMVSGNRGWWWPVGSKEKLTLFGKDFATGQPASTSITATFGGNDSVHQGLGGGHGAIDIGAGKGTYVIASKGGVVIYPKEGSRMNYPDSFIKPDENGKYDCTGLRGNYVEIDHGDGIITQYYHLLANSNTVKAGDVVLQGQVVGLVGSSGCSTGYHLHFAVRLNGTKVDPLNYVDPKNPRP